MLKRGLWYSPTANLQNNFTTENELWATVIFRYLCLRRVLGGSLVWLRPQVGSHYICMHLKYMMFVLQPCNCNSVQAISYHVSQNKHDPCDCHVRYSDYIWTSRCLKSPATWLFAQQVDPHNIKENNRAPHNGPLVKRNHRWLVDSPHKEPAIDKVFPYSDVIVFYMCVVWILPHVMKLILDIIFPVWHNVTSNDNNAKMQQNFVLRNSLKLFYNTLYNFN